MRLGFFVWEYPPGISGELGIYAENISRELMDMGHDISVFTKNNGELKTREVIRGVDVNRPMLIDGSNILPLFITEDLRKWDIELKFFNDILIYNVLSATKFVNELIKKEGYEFDIICAHDWLSAIAGLMIKKELGLPFVFHFHSTGWGRKLDGGSDSETVMYIINCFNPKNPGQKSFPVLTQEFKR